MSHVNTEIEFVKQGRRRGNSPCLHVNSCAVSTNIVECVHILFPNFTFLMRLYFLKFPLALKSVHFKAELYSLDFAVTRVLMNLSI